MRVLVACEESQAVCKAFRARGHEAYSCDIQECSGGHPEWHIKGDVLEVLEPKWTWDRLYTDYLLPSDEPAIKAVQFETQDKIWHEIDEWDLIIAHPPCTDLAVSGARWFKQKQADGRQQKSIEFFMQFAKADCPRIVIENPIGIMSSVFRKPDQIISPWQFWKEDWEKTVKNTCLWLIGDIKPLVPTHTEKPDMAFHEILTADGKKKRQSLWYYQTRCLPHSERAKAASKTFPGIAAAMADQWGGDPE